MAGHEKGNPRTSLCSRARARPRVCALAPRPVPSGLPPPSPTRRLRGSAPLSAAPRASTPPPPAPRPARLRSIARPPRRLPRPAPASRPPNRGPAAHPPRPASPAGSRPALAAILLASRAACRVATRGASSAQPPLRPRLVLLVAGRLHASRALAPAPAPTTSAPCPAKGPLPPAPALHRARLRAGSHPTRARRLLLLPASALPCA
nr:translation initiation factor IF-2-like [Aegilops tauschii subsp. strangulata]